jgi:hypothetical protein
MKVNLLLITASLGLLSPDFQAFSYGLAPDLAPSTAIAVTPTQTPEPTSSPMRAVALPRLSEVEIRALQTELTQGIDTWFGLAGLSKMVAPPPLSQTLQDYRKAWSAVDADVAPFLGLWRNSEDYPYSLGIFPSRTSGQVCVLEFKPEWSLYIFNEATGEYGKDVMSEQILSFSIATVQDGHLLSSQIRSVASATTIARFTVGEAYPVLLMGLMDDKATSRVVALSSPPTLPADLPEPLVAPVSQTLSDYGCIMDSAPAATR